MYIYIYIYKERERERKVIGSKKNNKSKTNQALTNKILIDVRSCTYLTCIPHKHKLFWQLKLDDFVINPIANLFAHERLKISEA